MGVKEIYYTDDTPENKISYYLLLIFLVTLPLDRIYSELALIGLLLHTLIHPAVGREGALRWQGWMVAGLFVGMVLCTFYAPRFSDAERQLEKQLALLLFPFIMWYTRLDIGFVRERLLKGFAFSCLITLGYLYGMALVGVRGNFGALFNWDHLNHSFSAPLDLHATYLSMFLVMGLVVFVRDAFGTHGVWRWVYILFALVLLAGIFQLASRAVCVAVVLILGVLVPWWMHSGRARLVWVGCLFLPGLGVALVVRSNNDLNHRFLISLRQDMQGVAGRAEDPEPRMVRWECAGELIRQSPFLGYGAGSEVGKLKSSYYSHGLMLSYTHELNAHNQYLSYWLNGGLPAVLFYIATLVAGAVTAWRRRDLFLGSFLVVVVLVSFSENILDTNKGIFFFSFFFVFLSGVPIFRHAKNLLVV